MNITHITVVTGTGPDVIFLDTDLPCGTYPFEGNQHLRMDVAADTGKRYVEEHFSDVPVRIFYRGKPEKV